MDSYEIKVIAIISAVVIALCVFTLVMELLRMKPGCCWLSPPLEVVVDIEKDAAAEPAAASATSIVITPILKPDSRNTPDRFLAQKRIKSASAVRFYAYNRRNSSQGSAQQRKRMVRAKTAGHIRKVEKPNGFYGVTFASESFELVPSKRKVSFTPTNSKEEDDDIGEEDTELMKTLDDTELEDEIPEDNTSTVSLESNEPATPSKPSRMSVSVETETDPLPKNDVNAGTQCEAFLFIIPVTYAEAGTQTDEDPDFEEMTAVMREVKPRASQGTQMKTPTPSPPPPPPTVCVDTACGPSTIDLIDPVHFRPAPDQTPPQREFTPPTSKGASRAKSRAKSKAGADRRKLKSRGMNLNTAKRAISGRMSAHSAYRPTSTNKTHPILKTSAAAKSKKQINYPTRSIRGKPPKEQWQIAAERVNMQQRVTVKPSKKTNKTVMSLKTALSEVKSFTTPPTAVFEVTRGILLMIGDREEDMVDWRKICNLMGRRGPMSPVTRLVNLNADTLTEYQKDIGHKILDKLSLDEISKVSHGASVLYKWIAKLINVQQEKPSASSRG